MPTPLVRHFAQIGDKRMKMIVAVIQPFTLNRVTAALEEITDFPGITVFDVRGFGRRIDRQGNRINILNPYKPKIQIEIVAPDELIEQVVSTIEKHAHTGNHGDGKIIVLPVETVVRVQTGETDEAAL